MTIIEIILQAWAPALAISALAGVLWWLLEKIERNP